MKHAVKRKSDSSQELKSLPKITAYEPKDFLCCHGNLEKKEKVWACAFEPSLTTPGETHNILATCGGDTVCLIDVTTGKTMKRYKDTEPGESFYALAWTTLEHEEKKINILAVAGNAGSVKLMYPDQLVLYSTIQAHKKCINCLTFHPSQPQLLFSGSQDGFIKLWDIGLPDQKENSNHIPLLRIKVTESVGDPISLVVSVGTSTLVAAAENSCVGWSIPDLSKPTSSARVIEKPRVIFELPKSGSSFETIDSLVPLDSGLVAGKRVQSGEIVIWDLDSLTSSLGSESKQEVDVQPLVRLKFPDTTVKYLNMDYCKGLLGVGDDKGKIHLYDVTSIIKKPVPQPLSWLNPSHVIDWPEVEYKETKMEVDTEGEKKESAVVVNMVAISSDHKFVVGVTDNNIVCVWRQES